jgi:RNA polymerase sigma-70 factor (ECF subfamily)
VRDPRRCRLEAYLGRLFGYGLSLANDRERARDLVQECALKALSAKRVPRDEAAYRAWLFRILRNDFLDRQRRRGRLGTAVDLDQVDMVDGEIWHTDDRLISALTVRLGMARLSPAHREVLAVVDIGGFSYAEAAAFLSVPVGTVMSRLCRARRALLHSIGEGKVRPFPGEARRAAE